MCVLSSKGGELSLGCIWSVYFPADRSYQVKKERQRGRLPNAKLSASCNKLVRVWGYVKLMKCKGETEGPRVYQTMNQCGIMIHRT